MHHGLFESNGMWPINDAKSELFGLAEVGAAHHDRDGASSNSRMLAKRLSDLPSNVLGSDMKCATTAHTWWTSPFSMQTD